MSFHVGDHVATLFADLPNSIRPGNSGIVYAINGNNVTTDFNPGARRLTYDASKLILVYTAKQVNALNHGPSRAEFMALKERIALLEAK